MFAKRDHFVSGWMSLIRQMGEIQQMFDRNADFILRKFTSYWCMQAVQIYC